MDDDTVQGAPPQKQRWLRRSLIILAGVVLIPVVGLISWVVFASRDIPVPDVSDLTLPRIDIPADQDAYTHFNAAAAALVWPEDGKPIKDYLADRPVDVAVLREWVAGNQEALEQFKAGLACEMCVGPQDRRMEAKSPIGEWRKLGSLMSVMAKLHRENGERAEALAVWLDLLRFGDMILRAAEYWNMWLFGRAVLTTAIVQVEELAVDGTATREELERMMDAMNALRPVTQDLAQATKGLYMIFVDVIGRLERDEMAKPGVFKGKIGSRALNVLTKAYLFQPNRTRLAAAEIYRGELRNVGRCLSEMELERRYNGLTGAESKFQLIRRPNMIGRVLVATLVDTGDLYQRLNCRLECQLAGVRLILALHLFEMREGHLPADLGELVPIYLTEVPRDPYDGRPFRYLPEKRLVYAVGQDIKDSGGSMVVPRDFGRRSESVKRWQAEDVVFEIGPKARE